jgi:hypothetical protein
MALPQSRTPNLFPEENDMYRISARRSLLAVLFFLTVVALPTLVLANHSWNGYHWARQQNPISLRVGDNVSSAWQPMYDRALSDWSASDVVNMLAVAGGTRPRNCRPTSGRVEVCSASYGNTGWLGVAQVWVSGLHITQGTVKLNDYYFGAGSQYNTPSWRELVTCQEIGHTLGLDHQDTNFNNANLGTCMDYTSNPDGPPSNTDPNKHDYDELDTIYAHLDSSTTVGQVASRMPGAMTDVDYASPSQWGKLVSGSVKAGVAKYDLDFGHGNHIFTFVLWYR